MPPGVFPHHVEQHLKQVKRDLGVLEAQVNAMKNNCEKDTKPWRQNTKFTKSLRGEAVKAGNEASRRNKVQSKTTKVVSKESNQFVTRTPLSLQNGQVPAVAGCLCGHGEVPCVGQVSTRICSRNHVHHTIKIPASAIQNKPPPVVVSEESSTRRTWREVIQQSSRKDERIHQQKAPSPKEVHLERVPKPATSRGGSVVGSTLPPAEEKHPSSRADPPPHSDQRVHRDTKRDALWAEQLELLQKEVRCAREEKDRAQREAAIAKMAIGKFEAIVEAQAASRDNQQRSIQLLEDRIKEMILKERCDAAVKMVEAVAKFQSVDVSPHTSASGSTSSSQRFRASSPAKSETSESDSHMSWHELSSIQSLTFNTL